MLKSKKGLTGNYSGIFGNEVLLKGRNGKVVLTVPVSRPARKSSASQLDAQDKFREAVQYARMVLQDPELAAIYHNRTPRKKSVYLKALSEYMTPLEDLQLDTSDYLGKPGDTIIVRGRDLSKVTRVSFLITSGNGLPVESGDGSLSQYKRQFQYTATALLATLGGTVIVAEACSLPGHKVKLTATL